MSFLSRRRRRRRRQWIRSLLNRYIRLYIHIYALRVAISVWSGHMLRVEHTPTRLAYWGRVPVLFFSENFSTIVIKDMVNIVIVYIAHTAQGVVQLVSLTFPVSLPSVFSIISVFYGFFSDQFPNIFRSLCVYDAHLIASKGGLISTNEIKEKKLFEIRIFWNKIKKFLLSAEFKKCEKKIDYCLCFSLSLSLGMFSHMTSLLLARKRG